MSTSHPSIALSSVWAKSPQGDGSWLPLLVHAQDTLGVSQALLSDFFPDAVIKAWRRGLCGPVELNRVASTALLATIAGVHDIGKIHPDFSSYSSESAARMERAGLPKAGKVHWRHGGKKRAHHTLTGADALLHYQRANSDAGSESGFESIASIVAAHHGVWHSSADINPLRDLPRQLSPRWREVQGEFLAHLVRVGGSYDSFGRVSIDRVGQMIAAGVTMMADWIASDSELFPYESNRENRVQDALERLQLPSRLSLKPPPACPDEHLRNRFDLGPTATARPIQRALRQIADDAEGGQLYIVEAATGDGKTEAACLLAEVLISKNIAGGIAFALPTQSTTDGMLPRILGFAGHLPGLRFGIDVNVAHGKKMFNPIFRDLLRRGRVRGVDAEATKSQQQYAHIWFGRKKQTLATFYISTVDAVAMAALNLKHVAFRHLGLAGKVVIIDEVHAYDAYLRRHLCLVLSWLGAYGTPVVLMSATLPKGIKEEFVAAYNATAELDEAWESSYPLVTVVDAPQPMKTLVAQHRVDGTSATKTVSVSCAVAASPGDVVELLDEVGGDAGCVLIIRNTVKEAVATATALEKRYGPKSVSLHHSRFVASDRVRRDERLLATFGSPQHLAKVGGQRPQHHVVVATQVVEQSLDVDFDLLITDLCPADLLLQRIGRLHRHNRDRAPIHSAARVYVMNPEPIVPARVPGLHRGSTYVYDKWVLLRTAAVLLGRHGKTLNVPRDVRDFVEDTYDNDRDVVPHAWRTSLDESYKHYLHEQRRHASQAKELQLPGPYSDDLLPLDAWRSGASAQGEESPIVQGSVRLGSPSLEVILVEPGLKPQTVRPVGESAGRHEIDPSIELTWETAQVLSGASVRIPLHGTVARAEEFARAAHENTPPLWRDNPMINQMPIVTLHEGRCTLGPLTLNYSPDLGLEREYL